MKLKPYPKYKDSGIKWIGEIPEGWKVNKVKHNVYSLEKTGLKAAEGDIEGDYPFFTSSQIQNKFIDKMTFNDECLIMGTGGFASVHYYKGKFSASNDCLVLKKQKAINLKFLHYQILNNLQVIDDLGFWGMGLRHLQKDFFYDMLVYWPTKQDQTAIANFLDKKTAKIDKLIEKDKKLIALLKEKRTALINHAVTKGLDPNVKLKDSGIEWIGKIPEGWEVHRLKFKETAIMGQSPDSESYNYEYKGYPFLQGNAEFSDVHPNPSIWCEVANKYALRNDVLLSVRAPVGAINIADQKYGIGRGLCAIRVKTNNLKYIFYQLLTCVDYLNSIGTGSTYTAISTEDIMNLPMRYPPLPDQTAIANYLDKATSKIDKTIKLIEKKIKLLEEYKKSLIHYVVTGKVDVRGVEA